MALLPQRFQLPLFIARRYSQSKQSNSFVAFINRFSVAGIAIGLMALICVVSVMNGFENQLKERILDVVPHLVMPNEESAIALSASGIEAVMPYTETDGVVQSSAAVRGVTVQGIDPFVFALQSKLDDSVLFGDFGLMPGEFNVVIGRALAIQLSIKVGDRLRIMSAGEAVYTPMGRIPSQRVVRILGIFDLQSQVDDSAVFMHWQDVMKLRRIRSTQADKLRVFLADPFDYQSVLDEIDKQSPQLVERIVTWRDRQGTLFDAVKMEKNLMFVMLLLIIAVAAFNIVSGLYMVVTEKQSDIAILQTQGMTPTTILFIFLFNGLVNGVKGAVIGLILGIMLIVSINPALAFLGVPIVLAANGDALPIVVEPLQIAAVIGVSTTLCIIASFYPALQAMKVEPADALRQN